MKYPLRGPTIGTRNKFISCRGEFGSSLISYYHFMGIRWLANWIAYRMMSTRDNVGSIGKCTDAEDCSSVFVCTR